MTGDASDAKELRGGRYALVRTLGEGSQGETWEAIDRGEARAPSLNEKWSAYVSARDSKPKPPRSSMSLKGERLVAIKAFRLGKAKAWKDVELAEREARILQELDHPNLPRYVEHFEEDGALYLVMEKIDGESLAKIRKERRTLGPDEVERMLRDVASSLRYLHGRSPPIVHRDIKPGNVIRRPDGSFALVDFGAVRDRLKPSGGSTVVGTFGYMAPEQFQGRASPKSDVYGAAATALAMLTGEEPEELPHEGLALDVEKALHGRGRTLRAALEAMLEPDPDRRAESIDEALRLGEERDSERAVERANRHRDKRNRKQRRRDEKRAKDARRASSPDLARRAAPREPWPIGGRVFAYAGLLVAYAAVWLTLGILIPVLLFVLSLFFGKALRRAAKAVGRGAIRAHGGLSRAWARVGGEPAPPEPAHLRVAAFDRVRAVTEDEAQRLAMREAEARGEDADAWLDEKLEDEARRWEDSERRRATQKRHAQRKHWGR